MQMFLRLGTQIRNAKQNWERRSAGTLTLVRQQIYLISNAGTHHTTAKSRNLGTCHAKGLQEPVPSSAYGKFRGLVEK